MGFLDCDILRLHFDYSHVHVFLYPKEADNMQYLVVPWLHFATERDVHIYTSTSQHAVPSPDLSTQVDTGADHVSQRTWSCQHGIP